MWILFHPWSAFERVFARPWALDEAPLERRHRPGELIAKHGQSERLSWAMARPSRQDYGGPGRRKSSRRRFAYPAQLYFGSGSPPGPCVIFDISELGAQLEVPAGTDVPDEFFLLIGGHADVRRRCLVVWRSPSRLGVRFQGELMRMPQQDALSRMVPRSRGPDATKKKRT